MLSRLFKRLRPRNLEDRMDQEMRFHLDAHIDALTEDGMPPEEARKAALREFGNVEALKEDCRDSWGMRFIDSSIRHIRLAGRQMIKRKGFTGTVILILGIGIGANTAIFSLANAVFFSPFNFPDPDQLVAIDERTDQIANLSVSYPNFKDWRERQTSFSAIGASRGQGYNYIGPDGAELIEGANVTHDYFGTLGISPVIGRLFTAEDDSPGAKPTVILGENFWRSRFGAKESAIGETIQLTNQIYTIVGVLPSVYPIKGAKVWIPLEQMAEKSGLLNRGRHSNSTSVGRLKPGVTLEQARQELENIAAQLAVEYPATNADVKVDVKLLKERYLRNGRPIVISFLGASGFFLLIVCTNIANMQLASSQSRSHEFGTRVSLGANRCQILGQLLAESLVTGFLGGAAGILFAYGGIRWLKNTLQSQVPRIEEVAIDGEVLVYVGAVSVVSSLLFGLAPIRQTLRLSQNDTLKTASKTTQAFYGRKWKSALIVSEFAFTCVLLVGAGLMIRTTANLYKSSPGFETVDRLTCSWSLPSSEFPDASQRFELAKQAQKELSNLDGVTAVGIAYPLPMSGSSNGNYYRVEGAPPSHPEQRRTTESIRVSNNYFETMGIRLIAGRYFNEFDTPQNQRVAIVDSKFAKHNFPDENAIGKRITTGIKPPSDPKSWIQIVGVVEHVFIWSPAIDTREQMYRPLSQAPSVSSLDFILKTNSNPAALEKSIRKSLRNLNPALPVQNIRAIETLFDQSILRERASMQLLGILAAIALLIATIGLYSVLSYTVGQLTSEIGIRMAVGASRGSIRNFVLSQGAKLAGTGLLIGLLASLGLSRFLSGMLYGVSTFDGTAFCVVALVLGLVGLAACWIPAARAARIEPSLALRSE